MVVGSVMRLERSTVGEICLLIIRTPNRNHVFYLWILCPRGHCARVLCLCGMDSTRFREWWCRKWCVLISDLICCSDAISTFARWFCEASRFNVILPRTRIVSSGDEEHGARQPDP